jgi:hypothetical protein
LAASWAGEYCFGRDGEFAGTLLGYGLTSVPKGPVFDHAVHTKLLFHAIGGLPHAATEGFARGELTRRLNDVYKGDFSERFDWTPFAEMVALDSARKGLESKDRLPKGLLE